MRRSEKMSFAIKAEVRDASAETFVFSQQKTMYGGKHIAEGDTVFVFSSENEGGQGLVTYGVVTSAEPVPRRRGIARQTPRVSITAAHRAGKPAARPQRARAIHRLERRPPRDRAQLQILSASCE